MEMLNRKIIEEAARELGAAKFGVGDLSLFDGEDPKRDPKFICPNARCIVGFGMPVPKGLYKTMKEESQFYGYTTLGVKAIDEEYFEIFLFKMASIIEDAGYDACLQRTTPNLRVKGDKSANPETVGVYELEYAEPVEAGKPPPDVMIDFGKAARACGIGMPGRYGRVVNREYGPFMRYAFIVTDAPIETNARYEDDLCFGCDACAKACDAGCIDMVNGFDSWKCWKYYGNARGYSLPRTQWGYQACLCGRKCDIACYEHITGRAL
jgi:epoxyqueuosine reductase QueG